MNSKKSGIGDLSKDEMQFVYQELINIFCAEADPRLEGLIESLEGSMVQLNRMVATGDEAKLERRIISGMRQGLREFPVLIKSIAPDKSAKIIESFVSVIEKVRKTRRDQK